MLYDMFWPSGDSGRKEIMRNEQKKIMMRDVDNLWIPGTMRR